MKARILGFIYNRLLQIRRVVYYFLRISNIFIFRINLILETILIYLHSEPIFDGLRFKPIVKNNKRLIILANGPSLREDIDRLILQGVNEDEDYLMMNFSVSQEIFEKFKPKYYALADPMFFRKDYRHDKVLLMFKELNDKTKWEMTLLLAYDVNDFIKYSGINNPNIKFQRIRHNIYPTEDEKKYKYFEKGLCMPCLGTVANMGLFAGIQYGYTCIELCGVDMSFFEGLCVNDDNLVCTIEKHYYDENKVILKPYKGCSEKDSMELIQYIDMVANMVRSYNELAQYAKQKNVTVINRTRNSMLDCFPRLIKTNPELFV